jgi:tRNA1Val (adenine37-N6)-methyltransferase
MSELLRSDETLDVLCGEKVRVIQKKRGYRLSMDPLLLANFVTLKEHETLLDVGTGCGIIPIYMTQKGCGNRLAGVEIQDELYELSVRNRELNGCRNVEFFKGDAKVCCKDLGFFHVVVSNPPYVKVSTGRPSPGQSRSLARCETTLDLPSLVSIASSMLFSRGRFYIIYPAKRLAELLCVSKGKHLEPKRLRLVHSRLGEPAVLFMAECVKDGGVDLKVEPPLYIFSDDEYSQEVKAYYA